MAGLAQGVKVQAALERVGIVADRWRWRWRPGMLGGVYPDHQALNGQTAPDILDFGSMPQGDVNGPYCQCSLQTLWRDTRTGRWARSALAGIAASGGDGPAREPGDEDLA